ncbi:isoprenoid synthase domain-containing protein [Pelagophyceae sp. CCMP2097]|nr:isoprenoid synthase domain-containing protein [Pelagophyceae sp. CCMP2097]
MARLLSATWLWCYAATALLCDVRISPPRRSAGRRLAATDRDAEPFEIVRSDLKQMKLRIKALVERTLDSGGDSSSDSSKSKSHPLLQGAAREFFERRERAFRPAVVLLVSRALQTETEELPARHRLLAEIVEMMCTAQIIHDSVLEDGADSDDGNVAHRLYVSASAGNKVSVLAGDFLLARCSVALSQLGDLNVVELMATSLESMVHGGVLFAQALPVELLERSNYERRTRLKTSALIADACRSAAILAGYDERAEVSEAVFNYATSLGLAYQTIADTIAFEAGECVTLTAFASSPPVILAAERSPECVLPFWIASWIVAKSDSAA